MSAPRRREGSRACGESDQQLVDRTRHGSGDAFAVLWERHRTAAVELARAVNPALDPDDVVSEAFVSILEAIRHGGGPHVAFRPYLRATVVNTVVTMGRRAEEVPLATVSERALGAGTQADLADAVLERLAIASAVRQLPERWKLLLWCLEVEGMKPREFASFANLTSNAVSALGYRARTGLRQVWEQHGGTG